MNVPLFATLRLVLAAAALAFAPLGRAENATSPSAVFDREIRPLLAEYCVKCHSTEEQKGELDLEPFTSLEAVRKHPKIWQSVAEQLANDEMPPKKKPQPTPVQKERLVSWVKTTLDTLALERAGDPGPVVLRRLSNAEYTYTVRDLTGVESLEPAREFPIDGAAGEGFMNTGQALVMSPALITKYLDAAKEIASHAVLLPDGLRFSPKTTRRDWTEEILAQIRAIYAGHTGPGTGDALKLQEIVVQTNEGGRLPLERYLAATLELRDGDRKAEAVASERGLSAKYLATLMTALSGREPSLLLDGFRARWRAAQAGDVAAFTAEIGQWQKALWKFSSVGHIGKVGGPKAWMEPVSPLLARQEVRLKIPPAPNGEEVTLYLTASDAGDGNANDFVVLEQPRLVAPGRPDLLLRDVRAVTAELTQRRERIFATTAPCLAAAAEASTAPGTTDLADLARRHGVELESLHAWLTYLGIGSTGPVPITSHFTEKIPKSGAYDFIKGWGSNETPQLLANSSGEHVRIPGNMKPHSIAVHPSPKLQAAVGWRSPVPAMLRVEASVTAAHPECGNGVAWSLELRRGATRRRLATGTAQGGAVVKVGPIEHLAVQPGDFVSLLIGPRDGNHSCDLTAIDLVLTSEGEKARTWNLATEVSPDVLAGNPHADALGHEGVWHFYTEPEGGGESGPIIPAGSVLAKWQAAASAEEKSKLAGEVQRLLTAGPGGGKETPDAKLHQQLASLGGPLLARAASTKSAVVADVTASNWGVDPALFGQHPTGQPLDAASLCVRAPSIIEIRLPADLAAGCELVTTGVLDKTAGAEGSVQLQVLTTKPAGQLALPEVTHQSPILINDGSAARQRIAAGLEEFRQLFPAALCYTKIVPVDEVVTLTLFHREDAHLRRLMLDDAQTAQLDRLWDELRYVSQDAFTLVDAFAQLLEYASQDADPKVFEPMRGPINERAAALRQRMTETEPRHLEAVLEFAGRAYRRPLTASERDDLGGLYGKLRTQELPHEEALRLTLARVLVAPAFLYRAEHSAPGEKQAPVNDWELANRLSFFLWSSQPDAALTATAAAGKLHDVEALAAQTRRLLGDDRVRRLAIEFACQWLHIRDFDTLDEKSERHFPTFGALRGAIYEESIRFFTDLFQRDGSVLAILDADHTFLTETLAQHYGIPGVTGAEWRRVDGVKKFARGGILGQAATLAKQSGASRTSPILRGNWVAEVLLGDKLPRPPKDVPQLPEDEATETLTVRQLTEKHTADPRCAGCHQRIDAFGFALESFDAIGRRREHDLAGRVIDTHAKVMDGTEFEDLAGLREYLLTKRRDAFVRQFSRKLLGYALGRGVLLSDEPLLSEMRTQLASADHRVSAAIEAIVRSRQFREIRGRDAAGEE